MKYQAFLLSILASTFSSASFADDFIFANKTQIQIGDSQKSITEKIGKPVKKDSGYITWKLKSGNQLVGEFDKYGLSTVTLSGKSSADYLSSDGLKFFPNQETISSVEKKLKYGCYYEGWGEGVIADYIVRSGPEGSIDLVFGTSGGDLTTKQIKNVKLDSITMGSYKPYGEEKYCKYPK